MHISLRLPSEEEKELSVNLPVRISRYHFGDVWVEYVTEARLHILGLLLYPDSMADEPLTHREFLRGWVIG
jgi:hypothetical protein